MFFVVSKVFWQVCAPSHVLVWCSLAAAIALLTGRMRAARIFAVATALLLVIFGLLPTYILFERGPDHEYDGYPVPAHVDGILTLGGGDDRIRVMGAYILARRYPGARVVYSGGSGALGGKANVDAARARNLLLALGLAPSRLTLEGRSRNTWENLLFTQQLVRPKPGEVWVLAIPGYQMSRAMAIAHRLNWPLIPWPTEHETPAEGFGPLGQLPDNLWSFDNSAKEWVGRQVYRWTGKAAR
jgi:uncharacterized SAM-binding protein YcdF (DUF218 family)